jgi:2-amino-4-hydroxy-6-hydroxymethyldihydropteridine diphosphokinase
VNETDLLSPDRFRVESAEPRGFRQVFAREGDGGLPLLLVHGWPETRRIWWRNIGPLASAGFDAIAPDLRGVGDSELGPDGFHDLVSHSRDLYALLHDHLGIDGVVAVAGGLGGAVIQDLSLRFPGFVERLVVFNAPLPYLRERMQGLQTRPPRELLDHFLRAANDADGLAAELDTEERRRRYVASFYGSRLWAQPGAFEAPEVDFLTAPFADGTKLRASFGSYEGALHERARVEGPLLLENPTRTLILHGPADRAMPPDFDRMAAVVFPDRVGPLRVEGAGHFLQWEAAELLNGEIRSFCGDLLERTRGGPELEEEVEEEVYLALGSNLGSRESHLAAAIAALRRTEGVRVTAVSPVYETDPVGPPPQGPYLNAVARLRTLLAPRALLARLLEIEAEAGRSRGGERHAARTLDLDLLLYGARQIDEPGLEVPHPRLHQRAFVLEPLRDLAAQLVHPRLRERVESLAAQVRDPGAVRRRDR